MTFSAFFLLCGLQSLIGLIFDLIVGDPQRLPHPARGVGRLIARLEHWLRPRFRNLKVAGAALCIVTTLSTVLVVLAFVVLLVIADTYSISYGVAWFTQGPRSVPWFSLIGGGVLCGVWFSWKSLGDEALKIYRLLEENRLEDACQALSMIVGRDTQHLDEREIIRAVVETIAENSVDGGIAPVCYALLGGPVLVSFFKAASTLDSMVGYRHETYCELGMVSARLDDALNYIPARLAVLLIPLGAAFAGLRPVNSFLIGLRDHARHPSPNSGYGESCFAGALGIQLGGRATYRGLLSEKPLLGNPDRLLSRADILRARRLLFCMAWLVLALMAGGLIVALI